jgi:diguanylate cyclase (GGDEF)-like protein
MHYRPIDAAALQCAWNVSGYESIILRVLPLPLLSFWRAHRATVLIAVGGLAVTLMATQVERQRAAEALSRAMILRGNDEAARIQRSVDTAVELLDSIAGLYASSRQVERDEFAEFARRITRAHPEIGTLEWAPRIAHGERPAFEAELRKFLPGHRITERDFSGRLVPAMERDEYFPIAFVHPARGNEAAFGFDLASRVGARILLDRAGEEGHVMVSSLVDLARGEESRRAVLMFRPIYRGGGGDQSQPASREHLVGFGVALLQPQELVAESMRGFRPTGLDAMLLDVNAAGPDRLLHFHPSRTRTEAIAAPSEREFFAGPHAQIPIQVPGGQWLLAIRPAPAFYAEQGSWAPLGVGLGGLTLTTVVTFAFARRARYLQEIFKLAQHDALTGLPNRTLFHDRLLQALAHAERERTQLAVFFLDLDRFKHINDSLGHTVGDRLLQEVARRLQATMRKEDTIARMGGDEFIILMQELHQEQDAAHMAEKLLNALASTFEIDGRAFYISASIGVSMYPRDAAQPDALVANADVAMYRAKHRGRNRYEFYSEELTIASKERLELEADLRHALQEGMLEVHYQPQVDLLGGRVIGAEALCRWKHPERGEVPPGSFIPIAEDAGLIGELGEWVLRQACRQARRWQDDGAGLKSISVNVASQQIQRGGFVETVQRVLEETNLAPERLELEVTEGVIMEQAESAIDTLIELSRIGVTLSIDDFGTGYSSLAYLKRLPIHKLKIDRSFIRDLPDDEEDIAITRAIVALANSLVLPVIAEGVETEAQRAFLQELGCQQAQGYLYGRPVPADRFPLEQCCTS